MSMCKVCFENIPNVGINSYRKEICICQKCFNKFSPKFYRFSIGKIKAVSLYFYDDEIKSKLFQLKGCFDYEIAPIFLNRFLPELKRIYKGYIMVPFPSTKRDDEIRGFNHVEEIFKGLNLPIKNVIIKTKDFKQSSLSKIEREKVKDKIALVDREPLRNEKVLIVDDVMTTGSSIKAAIELIASCQPKEIKVLLLSRKKEIENNKANALSRIVDKLNQYYK